MLQYLLLVMQGNAWCNPMLIAEKRMLQGLLGSYTLLGINFQETGQQVVGIGRKYIQPIVPLQMMPTVAAKAIESGLLATSAHFGAAIWSPIFPVYFGGQEKIRMPKSHAHSPQIQCVYLLGQQNQSIQHEGSFPYWHIAK